MAVIRDKYANIAALQVVQVSANVEQFGQILTGISLGEGRGMLIDSIEYRPAAGALQLVVGVADELLMIISNRDDITNFGDVSQRSIIDQVSISTNNFGTAVGMAQARLPIIHQFFPPRIIATPRIFCGVDSVSLASPATVYFRISFRYVKLSAQEYIELAEAFVLT